MKQPTLSETSVVVASKGQVSTRAGDEVVILEPESGMYYGLDNVGAHVWSLIQEPKQVEAIRDAVLTEYEVTPEDFEHDLLSLLRDLLASGLIEIRHEPSR